MPREKDSGMVPSLSQDELVEMILDVTERPERRLHPRHPIRSQVQVRSSTGTWAAHSVDVSAGGILLELEAGQHPPLAERLEITLPLSGTTREVTLEARPVRLLAPAFGSPVRGLMAAVFLHRDRDSLDHLEEALAPLRSSATSRSLAAS
jgi:hypothetical protein